MRFVVFGAGGVGGVLGGRLTQFGADVALIARGPHLDAIRTNGLRVDDPDASVVLRLPAAGTPGELGVGADDVVLLAMKSQDTAAALDALAAVAPPTVPIVCVQNGVANEAMALRHFERVYGVMVMLPAQFLEPGVVQASSSPTTGLLDIGRYAGPTAEADTDQLSEELAATFTAATFPSAARRDIMRWKYRKLLSNLANAIDAVCGPVGRTSALNDLVAAEANAVLAAAGIDPVSVEEDTEHRGDLLSLRRIAGARRGGGSTWQSLARGTGALETDYLNGEIVLLGRLHGVPTPANATLQRLARRFAVELRPPGSMPEADVLATVAAKR